MTKILELWNMWRETERDRDSQSVFLFGESMSGKDSVE